MSEVVTMKQVEVMIVCQYAEEAPELNELLLSSFRHFLFRELEKFASAQSYVVSYT